MPIASRALVLDDRTGEPPQVVDTQVAEPGQAATAAIDTWDVVTRGLTVGCNYGSAVPARDFPLIAEAYLAGRLPLDKLVGEVVDLDGAANAISDLANATGGRSIVRFGTPAR